MTDYLQAGAVFAMLGPEEERFPKPAAWLRLEEDSARSFPTHYKQIVDANVPCRTTSTYFTLSHPASHWRTWARRCARRMTLTFMDSCTSSPAPPAVSVGRLDRGLENDVRRSGGSRRIRHDGHQVRGNAASSTGAGVHLLAMLESTAQRINRLGCDTASGEDQAVVRSQHEYVALLRLAYLTVTNAVTILRLLPMSDRDKDIEILALLHQPPAPAPGPQARDRRRRRRPSPALLHRLPSATAPTPASCTPRHDHALASRPAQTIGSRNARPQQRDVELGVVVSTQITVRASHACDAR